MADVVLKGVTKVFGKGKQRVVAVDNVSLSIDEGLLVTLLGPSGCGKTTILRLIAGFEHPTAGEIFIKGKIVNDVPPQKRNTAMVFQSYGLFPHMTVFENVAYGLKVRRFSRREIKEKVMWALDLVDLGGLEDRFPRQLSGGQQQRVAVCRAIVTEPKVLLLDEPLSNLDAKLRIKTREELRRLQQRLSITSIYVTHDQAEAMAISDKIGIMKDGKIQQLGSPDEIYAHPKNKFVADFIGGANFYKGTVIEVRDGWIMVEMLGISMKIIQDGDFSKGDEVEVVVRPEAIDLVPQKEGEFVGTVQLSHYTGSIIVYEIKLENGERMQVEVANPLERGLLKKGDIVGINLHKNNIYLLKKEFY
jgi:iron(III) transport system ATP-binding protein